MLRSDYTDAHADLGLRFSLIRDFFTRCAPNEPVHPKKVLGTCVASEDLEQTSLSMYIILGYVG